MTFRHLHFAFLLVGLTIVPDMGSAQGPTDRVSSCAPEIEARIAKAISSTNYRDTLAAADEFEKDSLVRFGETSRCYAVALSERGVALHLINRGIEAPPVFEKSIALLRQTSGIQDPRLALSLSNYGVVLFWMRRYSDAARAHEEALELRRKLRPPEPSATADSLHNLADAYRYLNRPPDDVKKLYEEALKLKLSLPSPDDVSVAQTRQNLASVQEQLRQNKDAFTNLELALQAYSRKLKPDDARIAAVLNRQGILFFALGDYRRAETKFADALRIERSNGSVQQATLAATLDDFALNQIQLGRYDQARSLAQDALAIRRAAFPEDHPTIARTLMNLSYIAWLMRDNESALSSAREASQVTTVSGHFDDASRLRYQRHLLMLWSKRMADKSQASQALSAEAFEVGQQAIRTGTAATLARTALRFSAREPRLRALLKSIDDIDRTSAGLEQTLSHSAANGSDQSDFARIRSDLVSLANQRKTILAEIKKTFPDYSKLVDPAPLSVEAVQDLLQPNEALLAYVSGFEDNYVWCITREGMAWQKIVISPQELAKSVAILRASLDVEPEDAGASKEPLFSLAVAHDLYKQLVGPILPLLNAKTKLLVVPSGPLIGLPLHLLVASQPTVQSPSRSQAQVYKSADWMIKRLAIAELPSVESLEKLRRRAEPSANRKPLIGFANPLPSPSFLSQNSLPLGAARSRGGRANRGLPASVVELRDVRPLREFLAGHLLQGTQAELKAVADALGVGEADLYMGGRATETALKSVDLSEYRIVYFATHGYLAGKFNETEPSLALTVPDQPSEVDDGLLTASEITQLRLDADWVVLSACDTASGDGKGAEGLSGLARAFFHAGARALLVSNWSLDDTSAKEIMRRTFQNLQDQRVSKSQALRSAMLAQIDGAAKGDRLWDAYPGRWAPFEVVGAD